MSESGISLGGPERAVDEALAHSVESFAECYRSHLIGRTSTLDQDA